MRFRHGEEDDHPVPEATEAVGRDVIAAAIRVHRALGPGLLESVYHTCMLHVLTEMGHDVASKPRLPITFEGRRLDSGLQPDFLVAGRVIVEAKAVVEMHPVFKAQIMTYLRLSGASLGYLINFNVPRAHQGIRRFINTPRRLGQDT